MKDHVRINRLGKPVTLSKNELMAYEALRKFKGPELKESGMLFIEVTHRAIPDLKKSPREEILRQLDSLEKKHFYEKQDKSFGLVFIGVTNPTLAEARLKHEADKTKERKEKQKQAMKTDYTQKEIEAMSAAEQLELFNKHAAKPVKKFSSKAIAVKRIMAVLADVEEKKKAKKEKGASGEGRKYSRGEGYTLHKALDENPRREGTHGWHSWEALKDGMTYTQAIDAGARNQDLRWDIRRGSILIKDKDGKVVEGLDEDRPEPKPAKEAPAKKDKNPTPAKKDKNPTPAKKDKRS